MRAFGASDRGRHRAQNEDSFLVDMARGVFVVADGLGGLAHGEVASRIAVETVAGAGDALLHDLDKLVQRLHSQVRRAGLERSERIGTTLTLARLEGTMVFVAHVGDSIAYLHDDHESRRMTRDQTLAEQLRETGEARVPEYAEHILTQCLGQGPRVDPVLYWADWLEGARLLLCSDGISAVMDDEAVLDFVAQANDPEQLVHTLIDKANDLGGPDNITAVAVFND